MKTLKHFYGLLSAFIMVVMAGCSDTDLLIRWGYEKVEITAANADRPVVRTLIDKESSSDVTGILWEVDDLLGVFGNSTINAEFKGTHTEPVATATFSGDMQSGDEPRCAYYPYQVDATDATKVPVSVDYEQHWSDYASISANDIKASSTATKGDDGAWRFTFRPMVAMLRFEVDASEVAGVETSEKLESIHVEEAEDNTVESAPWLGNFTMNLTNLEGGLTPVDGESGTGLTLNLDNEPVLTGKVEAYACIVPSIKAGQRLQIHLATDKHWISFEVTAEKDLVAGACYDIPLHIAAATKEENNLTIEEISDVELAMESFCFEAARNEGKILSKEAYYDGSVTTVRNVTGQALTITEGDTQGEITGCIPYLYDFTLTPTFIVPEGVTVKVNGVEQTSGVSAQDFSSPVTYTLTAGGVSRDYVVTVTNTGLPVVVMTGNSGGTMSFLDMFVPAKTAEFTETDKIAIYDKDNSGNNLEEAACGFRLRGNSTSNFPKKPFAIKLAKKAGVLGMPKHKRWCLLANWIDRSLMRNGVAFDIAHKVENAFEDGLTWQPSGQSVELVLNGVHVGNYFLCEQIKIDENRLNIQPGFEDVKTPTTDNCGYLLEFDDNYDETNKFHTSICHLPCMSKDVITDNTIWSYVQNYVQSIETYLFKENYTAAYAMLDINSVADYWIIQELTMNREYRHPKSVYMYKNGEGKLFAGPVWDFDYQTFPNISAINSNSIYNNNGQNSLNFTTSTLLYTQVSSYSTKSANTVDDGDAPYMWYPLLFKDTNFKALVKSRWQTLYSILQGVTATIDRLGQTNKKSDEYNQKIWPMDSKERTGYGWFIDYSGDEFMEYDAVIENMKRCYTERLNSMNHIISQW